VSKLLDTIRSLVRETFPRYDYLGPRRYRVVRLSVDRLELQIVKAATGLPDILPISMWPGVAGAWAKLSPGAEVLVQFIDSDPAQPIVTHYAPKGGVGFVPVEVSIDADDWIKLGRAAAVVVREGDTITLADGSTGTIVINAGFGGFKSKVKA